MSFVETLHRARKARLQRIAARAVTQPEPVAGHLPRAWRAMPEVDRDYERAWAFEILGFCESAGRPPPKLKVDDIQRTTARHFGVERNDIMSVRRGGQVGRARQVAMYLAKKLTTKSYSEIARCFGGRDHTTILNAVHRIEGLIAHDGELADAVACIQAALERGRE